MLVWKKIQWLRLRIAEQETWIERCGGDLAGYIAHYGDPGVVPLDEHGSPQTFKLPPEKESLFEPGQLDPVPGLNGTFFKKYFGDGGSAIYKADHDCLISFQQQLADLETRHPFSKLKADMNRVCVS